MKIGILTFHSQLNYGGVLQCWALQTVLEKMGYEVVVIDREFEHQIRSLTAIFNGWNVVRWMKFFIKLALGHFEAIRIIRYVRTVRFVQKHLHLTSYSFKKWKDAPNDLGVDLIVVGSDQVWNGIWNNLGVYLLEGAPPIPAIGYAVSLGMLELPKKHLERYKVAVSRFLSVSAREKDAVELLNGIGIEATHVADPVLLMDWSDLDISEKGGVFCYFISEEWTCDENMRRLSTYAKNYGIKVHVFTHKHHVAKPSRFIVPHYDAGPIEFLRYCASARLVLTDSFHGLMFSAIFGKDVRVMRTDNGDRKAMFSRIEEFVDSFVEGRCVYDSVAQALQSCANDRGITYRVNNLKKFASQSLGWLSRNVRTAKA